MLNMSRRSFVKMAAATATVATLASGTTLNALADTGEDTGSTDSEIKRVRTVCRACGKMECGVFVTVQDGHAIRVEGDQSCFTSRGNCCTKSQSSIQACYHPDRLRYPMKRTNPKGEDPGWERVSWDDAMAYAAEKFHEASDKYGATSIFNMNGTSRMWAMGGYATLGIINGGVNHHVASCICKGPRFLTTSTNDTYGSNWMTSGEEPKVFVDWGANIEYSNYDDSCRNAVNAITKADCYISIDPRQTGLGKEADYWLNVRPGTDQAIALCWAHIIDSQGLMDELYMKRWTNAPFIVIEDMDPTGGWMVDNSGRHDMKTKLLKQCDTDEDGSYQKFWVVDQAKLDAGKTGNDALSFYDVEVAQWDGENITTDAAMTNGKWVKEGTPWEGWLPDSTTFTSGIDPVLSWEGEITLKDGSVHAAKTVWKMYQEMLEDKTPEWAEEVTGVAADKIEGACLEWATRKDPEIGNGGIHISLAMDQNGNNYQTIRCIMMLVHMTGNMDVPGGNRGPTHAYFNDECWLPPLALGGTFDASPYAADGSDNLNKFESNAQIVGGDDWPMTKWYGQWSEPNSIWKAVIDQDPYPIVAGGNDSGSFMNHGTSGLAWEAMNKLDFWLEANLWHHPTADCADILVPIYHWIEMRFPRISQGPHCGLAMNIPCVDAPGDCKDDPMFMKALAIAYGFPWTLDPDMPDADATIDYSLEKMYSLAQQHSEEQNGEKLPFDTYAEFEEWFQENGWYNAKEAYPKEMGTYRRYETGYLTLKPGVGRAEGVDNFDIPGCDKTRRFGFVTPTSKYEFWPTVLERYVIQEGGGKAGVDYSWQIPDYREPNESPISTPELYEEYPFIATTGRRIPVYFHSEHRQLPWCREEWPVPRIEMNPADAEKLGVEQGDWVWIETKEGAIRECVDIYYGIGEGVVNLEHAWWFPELSAPNHGEHLCNCNRLNGRDNVDPVMASTCMRAYLVKIYKATADNSPFGNPIPCDDDGTEIIHDASDPRLKEWLPDYSLNGSDY